MSRQRTGQKSTTVSGAVQTVTTFVVSPVEEPRLPARPPPRDALPGAHALNVMFNRAVGPWGIVSAGDSKYEITYSESWGVTLRHRTDDLSVGVPWANVAWYEPRRG